MCQCRYARLHHAHTNCIITMPQRPTGYRSIPVHTMQSALLKTFDSSTASTSEPDGRSRAATRPLPLPCPRSCTDTAAVFPFVAQCSTLDTNRHTKGQELCYKTTQTTLLDVAKGIINIKSFLGLVAIGNSLNISVSLHSRG